MSVMNLRKWMVTARERYDFAKTLLRDPLNDSDKNKAKEILLQMESELGQFQTDRTPDLHFKACFMASLLNFEIGLIFREAGKLIEADKHFYKSLCLTEKFSRLKGSELHRNLIKQLAIVSSDSGWKKPGFFYFLEQREYDYVDYKKNPVVFGRLFLKLWHRMEEHPLSKAEHIAIRLSTLGDDNAFDICRGFKILKKVLDSNDCSSPEWTLECVFHTHYFMKKNFRVVRHILSCANQMIVEDEETLTRESKDKDDEKWEELKHRKVFLFRCWAGYANELLFYSLDKNHPGFLTRDPPMPFQLFEVSRVKEFESKITCRLALNYEEARDIFLFGKEQVKGFLALNESVPKYVDITQMHSKLYKFLAIFENNLEHKCKLQKRRIDMLEEALKKARTTLYLGLSQELMFELGECHLQMMELKNMIYNEKKVPDMKMAEKINFLGIKCIKYYEEFIDTLKDENGELPETFHDEIAKKALRAHCSMCVGLLKMFVIEEIAETNVEKAIQISKYIKSYIEKNPYHKELIDEKLQIVTVLATP